MHKEADTILTPFHEEAKVHPESENTSTLCKYQLVAATNLREQLYN